jgi:serine/threonine protein kinase
MDQYGIWLERAAHGCLREYYMKGGDATPEEKLGWCTDVCRVLQFVHDNNIRHADMSGRNLLLTAERRILLCDFAGSAIDDQKATIVAEDGYRHPDREEYSIPTIRSEIHTLGSTLHEIMTGKEPHQGIEKETIGKLLEEGTYPDVSKILLGDIIQKCWQGVFHSVAEVGGEIAVKRMF